LYDKLIDAYVDNPSYITLSDGSSDILKKWYNNIKNVLCRIDKKLLPRYVKKKINHHIPYGYIIPKNKDVLKDRPVVSYFNHPFKRLLNLCSRGFTGLLQLIQPKHCVLWKTGDLKQVLRKKIDFLTRNGKSLKVRAFDIKQFYTNLDHDEIRKSVLWLFDEIRKIKRNCDFVSIHNNKNEKVSIGCKMQQFGWHNFDFDTLFEIVNMDLNNAIFSVGNVNLKQVKGVPMGSPLSPILAILVATYYEFMFLSNLSEEQKAKVAGIRYVDDIVILGSYDDDNITDQKDTDCIIQDFIKCYHKDLILEEEEIKDDQFIFLEGDITISKGKDFLMQIKNNNWDSVLNHNLQKIKRYVHWKSYSPLQIKKSIIFGAINRIIIHSSSDCLVFYSTIKLFFELRLLQYPWRIMKGIVYRLMKKKEPLIPVWNRILEFLCIIKETLK
jgi:hypothetical protein